METVSLLNLNDPTLAEALYKVGGHKCLVVLAGAVGAGKTRYRKRSGLVSFPNVDVSDYYAKESEADFFDLARAALTLAFARLIKLLDEEPTVVVYEATNMTQGAQMRVDHLAQMKGYTPLWVWISSTSGQCRMRLSMDGEPDGAARLEVLDRIIGAVQLGKMRVSKPNNHLLVEPDGSVKLVGNMWAVWQPVEVKG